MDKTITDIQGVIDVLEDILEPITDIHERRPMKESADKSMDNRQQQIARKQLMINRQKLQLQMKAVQKKKNVGDAAVQTEGAAWTKKSGPRN